MSDVKCEACDGPADPNYALLQGLDASELHGWHAQFADVHKAPLCVPCACAPHEEVADRIRENRRANETPRFECLLCSRRTRVFEEFCHMAEGGSIAPLCCKCCNEEMDESGVHAARYEMEERRRTCKHTDMGDYSDRCVHCNQTRSQMRRAQPAVITSAEQAKELYGEGSGVHGAMVYFDRHVKPLVYFDRHVKPPRCIKIQFGYSLPPELQEERSAFEGVQAVNVTPWEGTPTLSDFDAAIEKHLLPRLPGRLRVVTDSVKGGCVCWVFDDHGREVLHFVRADHETPFNAVDGERLAGQIAVALMRREARGE